MPKQVPNLPPVVTVNPLHGIVSPEKAVIVGNPRHHIENTRRSLSYNPQPKFNSKASENTKKIEGLLFKAIENMSEEEVTEYIASGANINTENFTSTPLLYSLKNFKKPAFIEFLIRSGADVNQPGTELNIPPLQLVCANSIYHPDSLQYISILLTNGAHINAQRISPHGQGKKGDTALMSACIGATNPIVKLLLENGAEVNIVDERDNSTALSLTVERMIKERFDYNIPFYMETIKILLEAGADIHIGKNPLEIKGIDNIPGLRAVLEEAAAKGPAEGASQRRRRATRKATRKSRKATRKSRRR
jgi:ankyrin repeat protein